MKRRNRKKMTGSIMAKMLLAMMLVTWMQAGVFFATTRFGGITQRLEHNSFDMLSERVAARSNILQNEMIQRWSKLKETEEAIYTKLGQLDAGRGIQPEDFYKSETITSLFLNSIAEDIIYLLRKNSVTGAFLILSGDMTQERTAYSGLYIRDLEPETNSLNGFDLLFEVAPPSVTRQLKLPMDSEWTSQFQFDRTSEKGDFFFQVMDAAAAHPEIASVDLGRWSAPYKLSQNGIEVISYSIPLIGKTGGIYGTLGVELSLDYLRRLLPYDELDQKKQGAYVLAIGTERATEFTTVVSSGPVYQQLLGKEKQLRLESKPTYSTCYAMETGERTQEKSFAAVHRLKLYNTNTPFEKEQWTLIGIEKEKDLLDISKRVAILLLLSVLVSLGISGVSVCVISTIFTRPITHLVGKLRGSDPNKPVLLGKINIYEIDELSLAIESLSENVADSASKLTRILDLSDIAIGAYEYIKKSGQIYYMGKLFKLLDIAPGGESEYIGIREFKNKVRGVGPILENASKDGCEKIYKVPKASGENLWLRLKIMDEKTRTLGVLVDITRDVLEKKKIEYERDYDLLTDLLNRRAFYVQTKKRFEDPNQLKISALMMMDLDNLKHINDTYGHEYGDIYIRSAADAMRKFSSNHTIMSRMSGDEFLFWIYGCGNKEQVRDIISGIRQEINATLIAMPDGQKLKIRASAGIAWYPDDADTIELLVKYADFAMYKVKNSTKGEISEFSIATYNRESYLLHAREKLNKLLDEELVSYFFQPIVDAVTGDVFGYEALMRSQLETLKSPYEILSIAKAQSQLYRIEHLTWFKAMADYVQFPESQQDYRLFINSIPSQVLSVSDLERFKELYGSVMPRIVVELTEEEKTDDEIMKKKQEFVYQNGGTFALDDYGTGYNGDSVLLSFSPAYVKVDMFMIRGIDADESRRRLLINLVSYANSRKIKVIAEGIETQGEMETVIACGAHYMQGYYLGVPQNAPRPLRDTVGEAVRSAQKAWTEKPAEQGKE